MNNEKIPLINMYRNESYMIVNVMNGDVMGVYLDKENAYTDYKGLQRFTKKDNKYAIYKVNLLEYQG